MIEGHKELEEKLKQELEEEELKNKISKLRANYIEIWVKEIKSVALLGIFIIGTIANAISYILGLTAKKSVSLYSMRGLHSGLNLGLGEDNIKMAMNATPQGFNISELIKNMTGNHIVWQVIIFVFLLPIALDWIKKRKEEKENKNASTVASSNEAEHKDSTIK